jgi:hypothetical protein
LMSIEPPSYHPVPKRCVISSDKKQTDSTPTTTIPGKPAWENKTTS